MPEPIMLKVKPLRKQTKMVVLSVAVALLLVALVGFAVSTAPQAGTYLTSIKAEDIPPNVPPEARAIFVGEWTMTLAEDHSYRIAKNGKVLVEGHFVSSAEQIRFTDETGDLACPQTSEMKTGTYKWSYQNRKLTFTPVTDNCNGRRLVLAIHSWTQAPTDRETTIREPPPTPKRTPAEDTGRYVEWLKTRGASIND